MKKERLPGWVENRLDELLGSGLVRHEQLAGLSAAQLVQIARSYVIASASGERFDPSEAIRTARATRAQRLRSKAAA